MRIKHVSIENFKCFKALDIDLGKLTLLTGANSSGKSSILYSILGALQSGEFPFQFSPNGKYVNMGSFQDISYKHSKDNVIKIGLTFSCGEDKALKMNTWWEEDKIRKLPQLKKLEVDTGEYHLEIQKNRKYTISYKICHDILEEKTSSGGGTAIQKFGPAGGFHFFIHPGWKKKETGSYSFDEWSQLGELSSQHEDASLYSILDSIKPFMREIDTDINFINSFRLFPERTYYETTKTDLKVGKFGEDCINQVILWETGKSKEYHELINILQSLSLCTNISSKRMEGGRFEIVVKVNENSVPASLNDVGFGISQFLPVIVADLQLLEDSTLFVAQPEIHLHPSIQASLGNYMIDRVKTVNKNYIIETHSEYLLNRVRLAIVKKEIPKEDVKIYYLHNDGRDVVTYKLEFTEDGQILNAPEDFFKTYMIDVMEIAVQAAVG